MRASDKLLIAERIKALRIKNDMTQSALARALGISRASVNAWEMGTTVPSVSVLIDLCSIFHVRSDYLLGLEKEERREAIVIEPFSQEEKELFYRLATCLSGSKAAAPISAATIAANTTNPKSGGRE